MPASYSRIMKSSHAKSGPVKVFSALLMKSKHNTFNGNFVYFFTIVSNIIHDFVTLLKAENRRKSVVILRDRTQWESSDHTAEMSNGRCDSLHIIGSNIPINRYLRTLNALC